MVLYFYKNLFVHFCGKRNDLLFLVEDPIGSSAVTSFSSPTTNASSMNVFR